MPIDHCTNSTLSCLATQELGELNKKLFICLFFYLQVLPYPGLVCCGSAAYLGTIGYEVGIPFLLGMLVHHEAPHTLHTQSHLGVNLE